MNDRFRRKLPPGSEGLAFESSLRRVRTSQDLEQLFSLWGYLPVHTPLVDFYEPYRGLVEPGQVYRFTDREGDLLLLRNDATLFLARMLGLQLGGLREPLRLWYGDSILRHEHPDDPGSDEYFQTGAEYLGATQGEADWEIILLAAEALRVLGVADFRVHLGSRALFRRLTGVAPGSAEQQLLADLERLSGPAWESLDPQTRRQLQFIGAPDEASHLLGSASAWPEAVFWMETARVLESSGLEGKVVLDLGEPGQMPYYTGLVFRVYAPGLGGPAVAGGRYDTLLPQFGIDAPSVGFSFQQSALEKAWGTVDLPLPKKAAGSTWAERLENARKTRAAGKGVVL